MKPVELNEKFTFRFTGKGFVISTGDEKGKISLSFTAGEALMMLDILKKEEENLKKNAHEISPFPMKIEF